MTAPIAENPPATPSSGVIDYAPPPAVNPTQKKFGKIIIVVILAFITFSWIWNLGHAVTRNRLSVYDGLQFVISIYVMIALWRGSPVARWFVFAVYAFAGTSLILYSINSAALYFAITGSILIVLATALALPSVTVFQRHQRQSRS